MPIQFALHRLKRELGGENADPEPGTDGKPGTNGEPGSESQTDRERGSRIGESLDAILGEVDTLRQLAEEFSRLAKLPQPELRPVDAGRLLSEVIDLYRGPQVTCHTDIDPHLPEIHADPRLLRQVLTNLFKNAVEAMGGAGRLEVSAKAAANGARPQVVIEIADSGPGVAPDLIERAGEPYVTTKKGGSGLGLALVHKIVADHRGRFELRNRPEGGALARVILPADEIR
jgi:nitrogen fixation/metabolism regulation signal transduction histidine kinase